MMILTVIVAITLVIAWRLKVAWMSIPGDL